jgi:hypothetical protein
VVGIVLYALACVLGGLYLFGLVGIVVGEVVGCIGAVPIGWLLTKSLDETP